MIKCYGEKQSKEEWWAERGAGRGGEVSDYRPKDEKHNSKTYDNWDTQHSTKTDNFITKFLNVYIIRNPINNQKPWTGKR